MLNNILKSKWKNLTLQIVLFTIISVGSYYASQYATTLLGGGFFANMMGAFLFLLGGIGCIYVSITLDDKYFELNDLEYWVAEDKDEQ